MIIDAVSVKQPWAGLIIAGIKPVENRSWMLPKGIHELAICASQKPEPQYVFDAVKYKLARLGISYPSELCEVNGACIGITDYIGAVWMKDGKPWTDSPKRIKMTPEQLKVWWEDDQIGWVLDNQRAIEPVPVKGQLKIYQINIDIKFKER